MSEFCGPCQMQSSIFSEFISFFVKGKEVWCKSEVTMSCGHKIIKAWRSGVTLKDESKE